jgi:hypothetical protein
MFGAEHWHAQLQEAAMSINLGPVRPNVSRDPDTSSFTPPDRRDASAPAAKPRE